MVHKYIFAILPLLFVINLACNSGTDDLAALGESSDDHTSPVVKRALMIGINDYEDIEITDLRGAVNDVLILRNLLVEKYNFETDNIKTLVDSQATRKNILMALDHLVQVSDSNDIVVVHFSGHGSHVEDVDGDESDGLDETIIPYDGTFSGENDIVDDEIRKIAMDMSRRVKNITFILDSCHSGTASRNSLAIPRIFKRPEILARVFGSTGQQQLPDDSFFSTNVNFVLFSGARASQIANEQYFQHEKDYYGTFTYYFVETLKERKDALTNAEVVEFVEEKVQKRINSQSPAVEGSGLNRIVFGTEKEEVEDYHLLKKQNGQIVMEAGAAVGVTEGSIYDVFPSSMKVFSDSTSRLGQVQITQVTAFESFAQVIGGAINDSQDLRRAVLREYKYGPLTVNVLFENPNGSQNLNDIMQRLVDHPVIQTEAVSSALENTMGGHLVVTEEKNVIAIQGEPGLSLYSEVALGGADPVQATLDQLEQWVRWFNVRELKPSFADIDVSIKLVSGEKEARTLTIEDGALFAVKIHNDSDTTIYINLLNLTAEGRIRVFWPTNGLRAEIQPGDSFKTRQFPGQTKGRDRVMDVIKLVATTEPVNLRSLQQAAIKSGKSELEKLLESTMSDVERNTEARKDSVHWATDEVLLITTKKQ